MNIIVYFLRQLKKQTFDLNYFARHQLIFNEVFMKFERIRMKINYLNDLLIYNKTQKMIYDYQTSNMASCVIDILFSKIDSTSNEREKLLDEIRSYRKQLGSKNVIGKSLTVVNGEIVQFVVNDRSHPQSAEIYAELNRLTIKLLEDGYIFDPRWISRKLRKDETIISVLCSHSEKLALALNLIQKPSPSFIQITNNLRLCGDCHEFMKRVAKLRQCEIVIRDANRIHRFMTNGECSCKDHF
ncbi:unnamed protein product [Rotaria sordida]|uniref:DYW domain-containing protein n=2 Tax=Rotaria sordida TaxID=392033 RepID=A0A819JF71_9BILA|nr:unnamed protein product [Rotaria sordida]CAF4106906.1 unnamed protein product [Rotaria sordida]